ncbi:DUF98 domain-containing protein [Pleurocapsales cyanobacterium LEGE 06147]|nr:DUF98 domain-containing protein [Pleurocapsales cyanobacterium LEGE 06147]
MNLNTELYRDIRGIYNDRSKMLEDSFWVRYHYLFWHNSQPLTLIVEVFSTEFSELIEVF